MKMVQMVQMVLVLVVLVCPVWTSSYSLDGPVDCSDIYLTSNQTGVYTVHPLDGRSIQVYCDMDTEGGGWTVFQRRMDGSVNFYRPWDQYKKGFGDLNGEYWLGLDNIHYLTRRRPYELLVLMSDFDGNNVSARYSTFFVGGEHRGYELHVTGFTDGGAGDSLSYHSGMKFTTWDKDQDKYGSNCARVYLGAFWHNGCHYANPNGVYLWGADGAQTSTGVLWYTWKGYYYSVQTFIMMIRPLV
ncbi:microfibril-associated glycoprotein 4-like [Sphaeramia orbicularis]|uniref:Microfibril-associated glycoprotein 4-like n=1 Tax=Sphaeramia orbicularis TaxID=375764 RepID=A0A673AFA8_9TELE|nr:microfibril-associated glycoprotein 4-like [Sphaeramia orbicularis]